MPACLRVHVYLRACVARARVRASVCVCVYIHEVCVRAAPLFMCVLNHVSMRLRACVRVRVRVRVFVCVRVCVRVCVCVRVRA